MRFANDRDRLSGAEQKIEYEFQNKDYLITAITHSSYANEQKPPVMYNERVEFLGDAVLELVMSDYLYHHYPQEPEGKLTKMRAGLVCEPTLATCARDICLGDYLYLGKGEDRTGGRERDSILSDAFESIIGAIYLDGGMEPAKTFIMKHLLNDVEDRMMFYDAKTILQEKVQGRYKEKPVYELLETKGPQNQQVFHVRVYVQGKALADGEGRNKKAAEQMAAYHALKAEKRK
jgi:ribonuclease-3